MTWDEIKAEIERTLKDWQDDRFDVRLIPDPEASHDREKCADLEVDVKAWSMGKPTLFTWFVRLRKTPPSRPGYSDDQWEFETSEDCWSDSGDLWQALFWRATEEITRARVARGAEVRERWDHKI